MSDKKIYTQKDVDELVDKFRVETELHQQLIWALVEAAGGRVSLPYSIFTTREKESSIVAWDDPETYSMVLQTKGKEEPGGDHHFPTRG